jgi:hypothetical protein
MSSERSPFEIAAAIADMKTEILRDIEAGTIPADVPDFVALHDHVDANDYAGFTDPNRRAEWDVPDLVTVQEAVDAWLKMGRQELGEDGLPPAWVGGRIRLVIEATVDLEDYREFLEAHKAGPWPRDIHESFDARMDEVFGPDGSELTTVEVKAVRVVL